jgi:hypothetical protein
MLKESLRKEYNKISGSIFIVVLLIFVIFKLDSIATPLYWDESIYLVPEMFDFGFSAFLPSNYQPKDWHGHPPLFQILHYLLSFIFTTKTIAGHILGLSSFIFFLCSLFYIFKRNYNNTIALFSTLTLVTFPFVNAFSTLLHPNFLMLALGFLSVQFYLDKKWNLFLMTSVSAVMIRESAIAFFVIIFLNEFVINRKVKSNYKTVLITITPISILLLFFIYNYAMKELVFNHPYFQLRLDNGFNFFQINLDAFYNIIDRINDSFFFLMNSLLLLTLSIAILIRSVISKNRFMLNKFEKLFVPIVFLFLLFFTFYNDTIVRDLLIFTILGTLALYRGLDYISPNKGVSVFLSIAILVIIINRDYENKYVYNDMNVETINQKTSLLKNSLKKLDRINKEDVRVHTAWPLSLLLDSPHYEYTEKSYKIVNKIKKSNVFINTSANSLFYKDINKTLNLEEWKLFYKNTVNINDKLDKLPIFEIYTRVDK